MSNKTRILLISASPKYQKILCTEKEFSDINKQLMIRAKYRQCLNVKAIGALSFDDLRELILHEQPHLVHFGGHGNRDNICFEDDLGKLDSVTVNLLTGLFRVFKNEIECVVFNSCYSAELAKSVSQYIPYVIGMSEKIKDESALAFSKAFYSALGAGKCIQDAFELGRNAVNKLENPFGDNLDIPVLYCRDSQNKNGTFLQLPCYGDLDIIQLKKQFKRLSAQLLSWPTTLGKFNNYLNQPELQKIIDKIENQNSSVTVLLGEPGCGKSALLAKLAKYLELSKPTLLAIKADTLPVGINKIEQIFSKADPLLQPAEDCIKVIAKNEPVVLLLDQVDALADLADLKTKRLNNILNLVYSLNNTDKLHIVFSSREFEYNHDVRLRSLDNCEKIILQLPTWEHVEGVLQENGVCQKHLNNWPDDIKNQLRNPQILKTYLQIYKPEQPDCFDSYQAMLEELWKQTITGHNACSQLINKVATKIGDQEELWLPTACFDSFKKEIDHLISRGILIYGNSNSTIGFRHQSFFEFARARTFITQEDSLFAYVIQHQMTLFIRPRLWNAVHYLRNADRNRYHNELGKIWRYTELREHVRQLLIEFLGLVKQPDDIEKQWASVQLESSACNRMLDAMAGNNDWFYYLDKTCLKSLIKRLPDKLPALAYLLRQAPEEYYPAITEMIDQYWMKNPDFFQRIIWILTNISDNNPKAFELAKTILLKGQQDYWLDDFIDKTKNTDYKKSLELLKVFLDLKLDQALISNDKKQAIEDLLTDDIHLYQLTQSKTSSIAVTHSNDFLFIVLPWIERVFAHTNPIKFSSKKRFLTFYHLTDFNLPKDQERSEHNILSAVDIAITTLSNNKADAYVHLIEQYKSIEWLVMQRLFARGLCYLVGSYTEFVLAFLTVDSRCLYLGSYEDSFKETCQLIQKLIPHLTLTQLNQLIIAIDNYNPYVDYPGDNIKDRFNDKKFARQDRLVLYHCIPEENRPEKLKKQIQEEIRAFPHFESSPYRFKMRTQWGDKQTIEMEKATVKDLFGLFLDAPDSSEWNSLSSRDKAGSIDLSRQLTELAKKQPDKTLIIIEQLSPDSQQRYAAHIIQGLSESSYPCEQLFDLILTLVTKGFSSQKYFQYNIIQALEKCMDKHFKPSDKLLTILVNWLDTNSIGSQEKLTAEQQKEESVLFGHGGGFIISSSDNYTLLSCISRICLFDKPYNDVFWLSTLKSYLLKEDIGIWQYLSNPWLGYLRFVNNQKQGEDFLIKLFNKFPDLLHSPSGFHLLANCFNWVEDKTITLWLEELRNSSYSLSWQAYGELIMLRHLWFSENKNYRQEVLKYIPSPSLYCKNNNLSFTNCIQSNLSLNISKLWSLLIQQSKADNKQQLNIRIGLSYTAGHLWEKDKYRPIAHVVLKQLLIDKSLKIKKAASCVYFDISRKKGTLETEAWKLLEILSMDLDVLMYPSFGALLRRLESQIQQNPEVVKQLVNNYLLYLKNTDKSLGISGDNLTRISYLLQRLHKHRSDGLDLFEKLIEMNLHGVDAFLNDIDRYRAMAK